MSLSGSFLSICSSSISAGYITDTRIYRICIKVLLCNIWYKSFPLVGVGRGQGVANLYGLMSIVLLLLFLGSTPEWTVFVGGVLCVAGAVVMFTEESLEIETLRSQNTKGLKVENDF